MSAISLGTGTDVLGLVLVDGKNVGTTGTPFTHTFRTRRITGPVPTEFEVVYPTGIVRAAGFPDTRVDFGFPEA